MLLSLDLCLKYFRYSLEIAYVTVNEATDIFGMKINCLPSKIDVILNAGLI
jgi:hypothetical protein